MARLMHYHAWKQDIVQLLLAKCNYSGTCLMWSPMGPNFFGWIRQVAALERCSLIFIVIIIISITQYYNDSG